MPLFLFSGLGRPRAENRVCVAWGSVIRFCQNDSPGISLGCRVADWRFPKAKLQLGDGVDRCGRTVALNGADLPIGQEPIRKNPNSSHIDSVLSSGMRT